MQQLKDKVNEMLEKGIIRPSTSSYSSQTLLMAKADGGFSPVVNYRVLNRKTKIESVSWPDIHTCFHWIHWFSSANYFATFDLNST